MYSFYLVVERKWSQLTLFRDGLAVDFREWEEGRDMGRQLFEAIDDLLKHQGLAPTDIADFQVETDVSDSFTSVKIAQTVAEMYQFAARPLDRKISS